MLKQSFFVVKRLIYRIIFSQEKFTIVEILLRNIAGESACAYPIIFIQIQFGC
jgi:hypothetical protein